MRNVGDVVTIRSDLVKDEEYEMFEGNESDVVVEDMLQYRGKKATITDIDPVKYRISIDNNKWKWTDEMFEKTDELIKKENLNE